MRRKIFIPVDRDHLDFSPRFLKRNVCFTPEEILAGPEIFKGALQARWHGIHTLTCAGGPLLQRDGVKRLGDRFRRRGEGRGGGQPSGISELPPHCTSPRSSTPAGAAFNAPPPLKIR